MRKTVAALALLSLFCLDLSAQQSPWRFVERATIGSLNDTRTSLTLVGGGLISTDGDIFISQPRDSHVRQFSLDGTPQATFGREGRGPGDLGEPAWLGEVEGAITVLETSNRRVSLFEPPGEFQRSVRPPLDLTVGGFALEPKGLLSSGDIVATTKIPTRILASGNVPSGNLFYVDPASGGARALAEVSLSGWLDALRNPDRGAIMYFLHPFPTSSLTTVAPRGDAVIVVQRPAESPGRAAVMRLGAEGDTLFRVDVRGAPISIPSAVVDSVIDRLAANAVKGGVFDTRRAAAAEARRILGNSKYYPAVLGVVAGADGTTWLRIPAQNRTGDEWLVLSPTGAVIARNIRHLPNREMIFVGERYALFSGRGDFDVPLIEVYEIER